jgi:hypothetical protein
MRGERGADRLVSACLLSQRVLARFNNLVKGALGLLKAVHTGVWLGLLSRETIHRLDERFYTVDPVYISDEHNLRGLFAWEEVAIRAHFMGCRRLLVTSAGAGREVIALRRMGFEVDATECNPALREAGNRLLATCGLTPDVGEAPRDACPVPVGRYDGAVVGWGGYMYIQGRTARVSFLRQLRQALVAGAPVLLSFFVRPEGDRLFRWTRAVASPIRRARRDEAPELGDVVDPFFQHYVSREEITGELAEAGFQLVLFSTEGYGHAVVTAV